jgi:hypothetical protein
MEIYSFSIESKKYPTLLKEISSAEPAQKSEAPLMILSHCNMGLESFTKELYLELLKLSTHFVY